MGLHCIGLKFKSKTTMMMMLSPPAFYRIRKVLENKSNTEEDRVAIVEQQLAQAKLIAEEADKKYEEVKLQLKKNNPKELLDPQSSVFTKYFSAALHTLTKFPYDPYCTFYS